jgi:hypothetical protein
VTHTACASPEQVMALRPQAHRSLGSAAVSVGRRRSRNNRGPQRSLTISHGFSTRGACANRAGENIGVPMRGAPVRQPEGRLEQTTVSYPGWILLTRSLQVFAASARQRIMMLQLHSPTSSRWPFQSRYDHRAQFPARRKTVTVVLPPPISGATRLYTPTMPETTATFCLPRAL